MRELIIQRLTDFIQNSDDWGIPRHFNCDEDDFITDVLELNSMSNEDLLEAYDAYVGFEG
jgi:hypothetical protein